MSINTRVLSGFVELLPQQQRLFDGIRETVAGIYRAHGFESVETPVVERAEVLFSNSGGETGKQIYRIEKGDAELALRFDLTVPFARYVADHYGQLGFPFKRAAIAKSYRGERAQKGRYREFYQADIDIVAEGDLPTAYDAEIIAVMHEVLTALDARHDLGGFTLRVSSRRIWNGFFDALGFDAPTRAGIMALVDKKAKISPEVFVEELGKLTNKINEINALLSIEYLSKIGVSVPAAAHDIFAPILANAEFEKGVREVEEIMALLAPLAASGTGKIILDLSIIRGLDYYTGIVFETTMDRHAELGSICGGGRYANLCGNFINRDIVGVGGSIGLTRLFVPLIEDGAIVPDTAQGPDLLIIPMSEAAHPRAFELERACVGSGLVTSAIYTNRKLAKHLEFADKIGAKFVAIIGDDELASGTLTAKNMQTGEQKTLNEQELLSWISARN